MNCPALAVTPAERALMIELWQAGQTRDAIAHRFRRGRRAVAAAIAGRVRTQACGAGERCLSGGTFSVAAEAREQHYCTRECHAAGRRARPSGNGKVPAWKVERLCALPGCGAPFVPARPSQDTCCKIHGARLRRSRAVTGSGRRGGGFAMPCFGTPPLVRVAAPDTERAEVRRALAVLRPLGPVYPAAVAEPGAEGWFCLDRVVSEGELLARAERVAGRRAGA